MPNKSQQLKVRTINPQNYSEFKHSGGSCEAPLGGS